MPLVPVNYDTVLQNHMESSAYACVILVPVACSYPMWYVHQHVFNKVEHLILGSTASRLSGAPNSFLASASSVMVTSDWPLIEGCW
jgi:hypothetical protein